MKNVCKLALLSLLSYNIAVNAEEKVIKVAQKNEVINVTQKDKEFTKKEVTIKIGDTVRFKNEDSYFHSIFSLSAANFFDLGSFPQGEHKDIKFEKKGEVEVECAIHPNMKMTIIVE